MCCHLTGLWTFRNWPSILQAHTIECVWERRTSMFPVLDTNLCCTLIRELRVHTQVEKIESRVLWPQLVNIHFKGKPHIIVLIYGQTMAYKLYLGNRAIRLLSFQKNIMPNMYFFQALNLSTFAIWIIINEAKYLHDYLCPTIIRNLKSSRKYNSEWHLR